MGAVALPTPVPGRGRVSMRPTVINRPQAVERRPRRFEAQLGSWHPQPREPGVASAPPRKLRDPVDAGMLPRRASPGERYRSPVAPGLLTASRLFRSLSPATGAHRFPDTVAARLGKNPRPAAVQVGGSVLRSGSKAVLDPQDTSVPEPEWSGARFRDRLDSAPTLDGNTGGGDGTSLPPPPVRRVPRGHERAAALPG